MNISHWGTKLPVSDTVQGTPWVLPVAQMGAVNLVHAGSQVISPTDAAVSTLTIPTDAFYAKIQVNGSALWYNTTGTDPVIATGNGYKVNDLTVIELWGYDQLAQFKMRAHTGGTPKVYVEYKKHKKDNSTA